MGGEMDLPARPIAKGIRLAVRLQPRSSRNEVCGLFGTGAECRLKLKLTAPPVEGAANAACQAYLAELFQVAKSAVRLVGGEKSKDKLWEIGGEPSGLMARLEAILAP